MDLEQLKFLTDAERNRYMVLERFFETEGWKMITEHAKAGSATQEQRMINAQTWDIHRYASGARAVYEQFVNLPEQIETEFTQMAEAAAAQVQLVNERDFE